MAENCLDTVTDLRCEVGRNPTSLIEQDGIHRPSTQRTLIWTACNARTPAPTVRSSRVL